MNIAFSGPRNLSKDDEKKIYKDFAYFISTHKADWFVGDADGLDNFVRRAAPYYEKQLTVFEVEGKQPWQFAKRSKKMVDEVAKLSDPWLYAFPNKLCPDGCKPESNVVGKGSGTWLTIAYAKYRGLQIYLFPIFEFRYGDRSWQPDWLDDYEPEQLNLF